MTRDPARIDPILADLRRYWHAAPDLRLGQMVMGLLSLSGAPRYGEFNAEDDKIAAYLAAWAAANPPPDHRDTLPPEIEAAIADAGQALVDAWDSAQDGPPHRFVVFVDPEGDPEVAAGWMAMARMHAAAIAAAREAGRREVLEGAAGVEEAIDSIACRRCGHDDPLTTSDADRLLAAIAADKAALDAHRVDWRARAIAAEIRAEEAEAHGAGSDALIDAICQRVGARDTGCGGQTVEAGEMRRRMNMTQRIDMLTTAAAQWAKVAPLIERLRAVCGPPPFAGRRPQLVDIATEIITSTQEPTP